MTRAEFDNLLPHEVTPPTDSDFDVITIVYNDHPAIDHIDGKKQIAMLYSTFGMRVILDMRETAVRVRELRAEISDLDSRLQQARAELQEYYN